MLKLENVSKVYRTSEVETQALGEVSLEIADGEFVAIMGPSGCGKSTLLNVLGLLDSPSSGAYWFFGEDVARRSEAAAHQAAARAHRLRLPELQPDRRPDGGRERRGGAALPPRAGRRAQAAGARGAGAGRHRPPRRPPAAAALRRPAAARRGGPGPGLGPATDPRRRAHRQPRHRQRRGGDGPADRRGARPGVTVVMVTHSLAHAAAAARTIKLLDGRVVSETLLAA